MELKKLILMLSTVICTGLLANEVKHQVSFGANSNLTWNGTSATAKLNSATTIDDFDLTGGNFAVNYFYSISERLQLGFLIDNEVDESEIRLKSGTKITSEDKNTAVYILAQYNFNNSFEGSWYAGFGIGREKSEDTTIDSSGANNSNTSFRINGTALWIGKRFSLKSLGIENLTYSPMLSFQHGKVKGDLQSQGIDEMSIVTLDILKLDLLF